MLKVENLHTGFRNKKVIANASFEIKNPSLVGLIGPNGCGKSTLLKAIAGVQPYQGSVEFSGQPLKSYPRTERVRALSYVAQRAGHDIPLTVREVVKLGRDAGRGPFTAPYPADAEIVKRALFHTSLEDITGMQLNKLSGGQIQRAMVARAMAQQAEVMLLDEPTNHLDLYHQHKLMNLLLHLSSEHNTAIILAIHDLALAARYCDRLLLLDDQAIRADGSPESVLTSSMLAKVFQVQGRLEYASDGIPLLHIQHPIENPD